MASARTPPESAAPRESRPKADDGLGPWLRSPGATACLPRSPRHSAEESKQHQPNSIRGDAIAVSARSFILGRPRQLVNGVPATPAPRPRQHSAVSHRRGKIPSSAGHRIHDRPMSAHCHSSARDRSRRTERPRRVSPPKSAKRNETPSSPPRARRNDSRALHASGEPTQNEGPKPWSARVAARWRDAEHHRKLWCSFEDLHPFPGSEPSNARRKSAMLPSPRVPGPTSHVAKTTRPRIDSMSVRRQSSPSSGSNARPCTAMARPSLDSRPGRGERPRIDSNFRSSRSRNRHARRECGADRRRKARNVSQSDAEPTATSTRRCDPVAAARRSGHGCDGSGRATNGGRNASRGPKGAAHLPDAQKTATRNGPSRSPPVETDRRFETPQHRLLAERLPYRGFGPLRTRRFAVFRVGRSRPAADRHVRPTRGKAGRPGGWSGSASLRPDPQPRENPFAHVRRPARIDRHGRSRLDRPS